jgi:hypothetical protein
MFYRGISLKEAQEISAETVCELVDTLRYLAEEHAAGFRIDAINMAHVTIVLARVDAALKAKFEPAVFQRAAE